MMISRIKIGAGSCGLAAGAGEILDIFRKSFSETEVVEVGCIGHCYAEPLIEVETDEGSIFYGNVKADEKSINNILALGVDGRFVPASSRSEKELLKVTALAGRIDPVSIEEYENNGGYSALKKALLMESSKVVEEIGRAHV